MVIRNFLNQHKILTLLFATLIIWAFFGTITEGHSYITTRNLSNLFRQMAITGILACGMVFVIISGEIDLSVGSLLGMLGGIAAICDVWYHLPVPLTILIVLATGVLIGIFNGYWISYRKIPSFIVTLAGLLAFRGILLGLSRGQTIAPISSGLGFLGKSYIPETLGYVLAIITMVLYSFFVYQGRKNKIEHGLSVPPKNSDLFKVISSCSLIAVSVILFNTYRGIPLPVFILVIFLFILTFISKKTVLGRRIYSVGGNMEATRMSGVDVDKVKIYVFVIMGIMAAIAGILTTARLGASSPSAGNMGELDAIASCFIGGTSMRGGVGTVSGALVGALIMASLDNGMSMIGVESFWQMIIKATVLLIAVGIDVVSNKR